MKNLNESVGIRIENLSKVFIDKDKKGRTPFLTALENQKVKAAQELIKHGADTLGLL